MYGSAAALLAPVAKAHQFVTFTTPPNLQQAVAFGLRKDDAYYRDFVADMQAKRDHMAAGLEDCGFRVVDCQGTYFLTADFSPLGFDGDDVEFCRYLTTEIGVAAVPVSAFYQADGPRNFVRFCFCKRYEVLDAALARLEKLGNPR